MVHTPKMLINIQLSFKFKCKVFPVANFNVAKEYTLLLLLHIKIRLLQKCLTNSIYYLY